MAEEKKEVEEVDYVKWLFELSNKDVAIAGGKGASLAEMFNKKFPVPPAFVITAQAFEKFTEQVMPEIQEIIKKTDVDKTSELNEASKKIRDLIEKQEFPKNMEDQIIEAYETIGTEKSHVKTGEQTISKQTAKSVFVAVRSSATTEDLATASFAGQQETFLNIKGKEKLLETVKKCFSSLYTPRAIFYRDKRGFKNVKALLSVVVQKMINSEKSGVMFTKNPIHDDGTVVIEAVFGLGEGIVSGKIKPDNYKVNKKMEIADKKIADKRKALVKSSSGATEEIRLTEEKSKQQVLTNGEIERLADIGLQIEKHYKKPQDIEFAIENKKIYIVQSRPITTSAKGKGKALTGKVLLTGLSASPGVATGKVKIVKSMADLDKVEKGDILVTEMTNPDMVVTMQRSDAIVTDEGGATSHAAIVSREMGIPCVVGTREATSLLKDGQIVTVVGASGKVFDGKVGEEKKKEVLPIVPTKLKIKVILDLPEFAGRAAKTKCTDVGLLRLEGIIASSGKHPLLFLAEERLAAYTKLLQTGLEKIAEHFESVWVRASDIRTDEFRNLQGSPKEVEVNPMLGFHGVRFSLKNKPLLEAELQAIKNVAEKFPDKKIGIMFPQIITVEETIETRKEFEKFKKDNMEFGIMVETPAAVQIIGELCDVGLDFISFGTNDLTQYTLAVDRGNENSQHLYNETHPAVLRQIEHVIRICKEKGVETSICGQAASKKEMVRSLIDCGIDSISVNADAANEISKFVQELEQKSPEPTPEPEEELPTEEPTPPESTEELSSEPVEEFPDTDINIDIFSPKQQEMLAAPGEERRETVIGSIITKAESQEFPETGIEFDFFKPMMDSILEPGHEPISGPKSPFNDPPTIGHQEPSEPEEDEEVKEVVEEMQGKADEEDIDIPKEDLTKDIDENVLDIF
jgi:pyruvate,water dikinase